jgi:hypothetical protein
MNTPTSNLVVASAVTEETRLSGAVPSAGNSVAMTLAPPVNCVTAKPLPMCARLQRSPRPLCGFELR